jgi:tRNA(Ile)-lysidine synthase
MAAPSKPPNAVDAVDAVDAAVDDALRRHFGAPAPESARRARATVALSGGGDSVLLLDAVARAAPRFAIEIDAVHVHHGLSPNADSWAAFCADLCARRGVPLTVARVAVERRGGQSLEAAARDALRAVFVRCDTDTLCLAHHADDQAETLWLQLLRGAGPHGLAAMAAQRAASVRGPRLLRPLLGLPRAVLAAAARARGLQWIEDESNADTRIRRNFMRHEVLPAIARLFPGYPATLVRAAAHQADAARLVDELAASDAEGALDGDPVDGPTLDRRRLATLAAQRPHRARNLLRWFLRHHGVRAPSTARLADMLAQLSTAAADARVRVAHDGVEVGLHRGRIFVHLPPETWAARAWQGESAVDLPHGRLRFALESGDDVGAALALLARIEIGRRRGGERLRSAANRPAQAVAQLMQQAGIPHWRRDHWPLLFRDGTLVAVPGLADQARIELDGTGIVLCVAWLPKQRPGFDDFEPTAAPDHNL